MANKNAQPIFADAIVEHQLDLFRAEAAMPKDVNKVLNALERRLIELVLEVNPTGQRKVLESRKVQKKFLDKASSFIAESFKNIQKESKSDLLALAEVEALFIAKAVNTSLGEDVVQAPSVSKIQELARASVLGYSLTDWFKDGESKYSSTFTNVMQGAFLEGLSDYDTVKRLRASGLTKQSSRKLNTLVRTASASVTANVDRHMYQTNPDIFKGIQQISTFDSRTSTVCQSYAGAIWDLNYKPIGHKLPYNGGVPRHPNCRSRERGVLDEKYGLPEKDLSFDSYLKRISQKRRRELLGRKTADLWETRGLTARQLVDSTSGRPIPVDDLYKPPKELAGVYKENIQQFEADGVARPKEKARFWTEANPKYPYKVFKKDLNNAFDAKLVYGASGRNIKASLRNSDVYYGIDRTFKLDQSVVVHDYLRLHESQQGKGLVKKAFAKSMKVYEKMGVKSVEVHAALDRGAYAWAKYGFVPDKASWKELQGYLRPGLNAIRDELPENTYKKVNGIINSSNPKSIWILVDLKDQYNNDNIGKHLLYGQHWLGSLNIEDKETMERFWHYVG